MRKLLLLAAAAFALALSLVTVSVPAEPAPWPQPTIYVVNRSSLPQAELEDALPAFQLAVDQDFRRYWNQGALLVASYAPPKGAWVITLEDTGAEDCQCLGYHDVTPGFLPRARVFVEDSEEDDLSWSVVFTHELFEMLADPRTNRAVVTGPTDNYVYRWLEVADPVEALSYTRPGLSGAPVQISDFVTERWWDTGATRGPFDIMGKVKRPLQILDGGYEGWYGPCPDVPWPDCVIQ